MGERGPFNEKMIIHNHSQNYFIFITFKQYVINIIFRLGKYKKKYSS